MRLLSASSACFSSKRCKYLTLAILGGVFLLRNLNRPFMPINETFELSSAPKSASKETDNGECASFRVARNINRLFSFPKKSKLQYPVPSSTTGGEWTWYYATKDTTTVDSQNNNSSVLVAQFSGNDPKYTALLETALPVHKAYASKWGYDFVTFQGVIYGCLEWHATSNKIGIVGQAMQLGYRRLLLMDSDAIIVDFDTPVTDLLQTNDTMIAAQRVTRNNIWDINIGVMAINLEHEMLPAVLSDWYTRDIRCLRRSVFLRRIKYAIPIPQLSHLISAPYCDDQADLHATLMEYSTSELMFLINRTNDVFSYARGTLVKHFVRPEGNMGLHGWHVGNNTVKRLDMMRNQAKMTIEKYPLYFSNKSS